MMGYRCGTSVGVYWGVLTPSALQSECSGRASRARKLGSCADTRMIEFGLFVSQVRHESEWKDMLTNPRLQLDKMSR